MRTFSFRGKMQVTQVRRGQKLTGRVHGHELFCQREVFAELRQIEIRAHHAGILLRISDGQIRQRDVRRAQFRVPSPTFVTVAQI